MKVGDVVFNAFVGSEAGTMADVRPVILVKRSANRWKYAPTSTPRIHFCCNDNNRCQRLFEDEAEAYWWIVSVMKNRVKSAEAVLANRKQVVREFEQRAIKAEKN